jgi:hypothetical protein
VIYSKSEVNRAGQIFAEQVRTAAEGKRNVGDSRAELMEVIATIDWWRSEYAKPLSRVGANLRYYAAVEGKPVVAQRLKKLPTMIGKLFREPGMKLARMEDIGGVRAVPPESGGLLPRCQQDPKELDDHAISRLRCRAEARRISSAASDQPQSGPIN